MTPPLSRSEQAEIDQARAAGRFKFTVLSFCPGLDTALLNAGVKAQAFPVRAYTHCWRVEIDTDLARLAQVYSSLDPAQVYIDSSYSRLITALTGQD